MQDGDKTDQGQQQSGNNSGNQSGGNTTKPEKPTTTRPSTNTSIQTHSDQRDHETKKKGK